MKTTFQLTEDDLQPWGRRPSGVRGRRLVQVNRRRPTGSTEDDLRGQPKTTFKVKRRRPSRSTEDDLRGRSKTTFKAQRRRPSGTSEDDLRKRKTTFHSSHRLPMQITFRLSESDQARGCGPDAAPLSTTLPDRRDQGARPLSES